MNLRSRTLNNVCLSGKNLFHQTEICHYQPGVPPERVRKKYGAYFSTDRVFRWNTAKLSIFLIEQYLFTTGWFVPMSRRDIRLVET
jgi:hypothetical protein